MSDLRQPILLNAYEREVDGQLARLSKRYDARVFAKVGLKDVLPIRSARLTREDLDYAFKAHFDFVIADPQNEAVIAIEFDGGRHRTDAQQIIRDDRKNRICKEFRLPLIRAGASSLHKADHRTLLEWLIELFFEERRLLTQWDEYEESGEQTDAPDYDLRDFDYQRAWKLRDRGLDAAGPLDPFGEARAMLSRFYWRDPITAGLKGWYGSDARGHTVGHVALEVQDDRWLLSTGRCDLRGIELWLDSVFPPSLAQDLALLGLARQLDAWQRSEAETLSLNAVESAVEGSTEELFQLPNLPNHREQSDLILEALRAWGVDADDPLVRVEVRDGLQRDGESDDDYYDRMQDRELREELLADNAISWRGERRNRQPPGN